MAAHALSQGSETHSEENAIHPPLHTQAHRHPWLASKPVIDRRRERAICWNAVDDCGDAVIWTRDLRKSSPQF